MVMILCQRETKTEFRPLLVYLRGKKENLNNASEDKTRAGVQ